MSKLLTAQQQVITELILDNKKLQEDLSRVLADYNKDLKDLQELQNKHAAILEESNPSTDTVLTALEEQAFYESGLAAHGCLENLDAYALAAIKNYGRYLLKKPKVNQNNNMNNTPETAKAERMAWSQEYMVDTEFARKLERERDEARKELEEYRSIAENIGAVKAVSEKEKAICERNEALNKMADALMEVDLRTLDYERMKQERDEAREALMKIEDLFIDGTDIYADRENMGIIARNALEGLEGAK